MNAAALAIDWTEQGLLPDAMIRAGVRRLLRERLAALPVEDCAAHAQYVEHFVHAMHEAPIAPLPHKANEQHYEVPAELYAAALGPHLKYSSCYWPAGVDDLAEAERAALQQTCERAELGAGMRILELGCGWGSLSLWMAEHYPQSAITAVSNSASQRSYIQAQARSRGLNNLEVITSDMNVFDIVGGFDRIVSVEMFEHMRNYRTLLRRIHRWLHPGGRFFMHIFCHRSTPYEFIDQGPSDWMTRHFFAGGLMPSDELPLRFQDDLRLVQRWRWSGEHYERTASAWLENLDRNRDQVWPVLERTYGESEARRWFMRWRVFFMACAELFGYERGQQWWVSHYLFERPR